MKAIDSGMNVFFIQKPCGSACSNTKIIPWSGLRLKRYISPVERCVRRRGDLGDELVLADRQAIVDRGSSATAGAPAADGSRASDRRKERLR